MRTVVQSAHLSSPCFIQEGSACAGYKHKWEKIIYIKTSIQQLLFPKTYTHSGWGNLKSKQTLLSQSSPKKVYFSASEITDFELAFHFVLYLFQVFEWALALSPTQSPLQIKSPLVSRHVDLLFYVTGRSRFSALVHIRPHI